MMSENPVDVLVAGLMLGTLVGFVLGSYVTHILNTESKTENTNPEENEK